MGRMKANEKPGEDRDGDRRERIGDRGERRKSLLSLKHPCSYTYCLPLISVYPLHSFENSILLQARFSSSFSF